MSLDVLTAIWRDPPCKGGDLLCLLAIADNADDDGYAWPAVETIARKAAISERGAQKCLKKLADAGLISVIPGGGRGKTNAYQITTNGIGPAESHKNPEQNTPNPGSPFSDTNPELSNTNPEQSDAKPRTPVHPNSKEPSEEQSLPPKSPTDILCETVRPETARDFAAHRKAMKTPLTKEAAIRIVNKLADHPDPDAVLDESIENGWRGIFPNRTKRGQNDQSPSKSKRRVDAFIAGARGTVGSP